MKLSYKKTQKTKCNDKLYYAYQISFLHSDITVQVQLFSFFLHSVYCDLDCGLDFRYNQRFSGVGSTTSVLVHNIILENMLEANKGAAQDPIYYIYYTLYYYHEELFDLIKKAIR